MKPSVLSELVTFNITDEGVTLKLSLAALKALVSASEQSFKHKEAASMSSIDSVEGFDQGLKPHSLLVSISDATAMLGICPASLYKLLKSGALRAVKCGSRTMLPVEALHDYVESLAPYAPLTLNERKVNPVPPPDAAPSKHRKLRFKAVMALTGLSRQQLFVRRNAGTFPPGVTLSSGVLGWDRADVDAWIADPAGYRAEPKS